MINRAFLKRNLGKKEEGRAFLERNLGKKEKGRVAELNYKQMDN